MALWGDRETTHPDGDAIYGNVHIGTRNDDGTITLISSIGQANNINFTTIKPGQIITFDDDQSAGYLLRVLSNSAAVIVDNGSMTPFIFIPRGIRVSEKPSFVVRDSAIGADITFGVDSTEIAAENNYKPAHAGWVKAHSYEDSKGNVRYKSEVLVAMGSIQGDADDDDAFPDS